VGFELGVPYGNRLEALKDDRKGQHSIRVNDQWRVCFRWHGEDACCISQFSDTIHQN
jgi:proteic killer suppression protein